MNTSSYASQLLKLFVVSKFLVLIGALISSFFLKPYTQNTELILLEEEAVNGVDELVRKIFTPFARWDSVYFLKIAHDGYQWEQQYAFFPLYPLFMRHLASLLSFITGWSMYSNLLISGVLISTFSHFLIVCHMFRISLIMGSSEYFAFISSFFAIFSPAFPFLNAIYTEGFFGALVLSGMICYYSGSKVFGAIFWLLASLTRSNGFLLSGFFFWEIIEFAVVNKRLKIWPTIRSLLLGLIVVMGYVGVQGFGYLKFCYPVKQRPWCYRQIPSIYSFVQDHYWNVGLLRYFKMAQIPNFFIAAPTFFLLVWGIYVYFKLFTDKKIYVNATHSILTNKRIFPHIVLMIFLLIYTALIAHVQIAARLFSFQPLLYWILAHLYIHTPFRRQILCYSLSFVIVGTLLFMNAYPPA